MAEAGPNMVVDEDSVLVFDGSGSFDNSGVMFFNWTFTDWNGSVSLSGVNPHYSFVEPGSYNVILNLTDTAGNGDEDTLNVMVRDVTPPVADAGPDKTVNAGEVVVFDGSMSYDNVGIVDHVWSFTDGKGVSIEGEVASHIFRSPGIYEVLLNVTDSHYLWDTDMLIVKVIDLVAPKADAGPDMTIPEDKPVTLDATASSDNSGILGYHWLIHDLRSCIMFEGVNPTYTFDDPGNYVVDLTVTDVGYLNDTDSLNITVTDVTEPSANAGSDTKVRTGSAVTFNASCSSDNVRIVNYTWSFQSERGLVRIYGSIVRYEFMDPGSYEVTLRVVDGAGNSDTDSLNVTVERDTIPIGEFLIPSVALVIVISAIMVFVIRHKRKGLDDEEWELME
jgi:PKD repeat protein